MDRIDLNVQDPLPDLLARFRLKRGLFRKEMVESPLFGLDQYGCVFKTDKIFEAGDTIQFDLVMHMPFEDIEAEALQGLVVEVKKHCSNFFYSIDFIQSPARQSSEIVEKLGRIQEVLDRKQVLRSRRGRPSADFSPTH